MTAVAEAHSVRDWLHAGAAACRQRDAMTYAQFAAHADTWTARPHQVLRSPAEREAGRALDGLAASDPERFEWYLRRWRQRWVVH